MQHYLATIQAYGTARRAIALTLGTALRVAGENCGMIQHAISQIVGAPFWNAIRLPCVMALFGTVQSRRVTPIAAFLTPVMLNSQISARSKSLVSLVHYAVGRCATFPTAASREPAI